MFSLMTGIQNVLSDEGYSKKLSLMKDVKKKLSLMKGIQNVLADGRYSENRL